MSWKIWRINSIFCGGEKLHWSGQLSSFVFLDESLENKFYFSGEKKLNWLNSVKHLLFFSMQFWKINLICLKRKNLTDWGELWSWKNKFYFSWKERLNPLRRVGKFKKKILISWKRKLNWLKSVKYFFFSMQVWKINFISVKGKNLTHRVELENLKNKFDFLWRGKT